MKAVNDLKLPFKLIFGKIGKLSLSIPWKQNFSVPTVVDVNQMQVVLKIVNKSEWEANDYNSYENKEYYLLKFANEKIYQLSQALKPESSKGGDGYLDRLFAKILDNLHLNFKNINIRIEDNNNKKNKFSFGVTLKEMLVVNTNENWEQEFIDRSVQKNIDVYKLLRISKFGIYFIVNEEHFISEYAQGDISEQMSNFFKEDKDKAEGIEYLIQPISLEAKMKQNQTNNDIHEPRNTLFINLDKFNFLIRKMQFDCLIRAINEFSNYQKFQYDFDNTIKYKKFKPKYKLSDNDNNKQKNIPRKELIMSWWKYAIKMVIKQIQYSKGNDNVFKLNPVTALKRQNAFMPLFKKYFKDRAKGLNESELNEFKYILETTELKELFIWSKPVLQEIYTEKKKEEKKMAQESYFSLILGVKSSNTELLTKEEEKMIEEILTNEVNKETSLINNKEKEIKWKINFTLNEGSFDFSKKITAANANIIEGFGFHYKHLNFSFKKGEYFLEVDGGLKEFQVEMVTQINKNIIRIPITFKELKDDMKINNPEMHINKNSNINSIVSSTSECSSSTQTPVQPTISATKEEIPDINETDNCFLKLSFRKNNPTDNINTYFSLTMNVLHITYHQVFLERIKTFFYVSIDEELANKAWEQLNKMKENTQHALKENMYKTNIIELNIEPRKVIIPINKYDIKNTKILLLDLGKISTLNELELSNTKYDDKYKEQYSMKLHSCSLIYYPSFKDMLKSKSEFNIITNITGTLTFAVLDTNFSAEVYPSLKMILNIPNINIDLNVYIYTLLFYIVDILRPTKEVDLWSQLNASKDEITKNVKALSKVQKKNSLYLNYEDFFAVLASGYIYFYKSSEDDEYVGYYYLKDTKLNCENENMLIMKLTNQYGSVELKFPNDKKYKQWKTCINERILEMKMSSNDKEKEIDLEIHNQTVNPNLIYFGAEILLNTITCNLHTENESNSIAFIIDINHLFAVMLLTEYETEMKLSLGNASIISNNTAEEEFRKIISSGQSENNQLMELTILICDENSKRYKNTQIDISFTFGYLDIIWHPNTIRSLLSILAHNNITKHKIGREISNQNEQLLDSNFLMPGTEEVVAKPQCTIETYTYIKFHAQLEQVNMIWVQPKLNIKLCLLRFGKSFLNCIMKVDHFVIEGELGNSQLFDLSNYPFVYENNNEYDESKNKEIFGIKERNTKSLITFEYKSMYNWCPECKDNFLSEANVKINSAFLVYFHEQFMRFFNYFTDEFLGALGANDEVKAFMNKHYKIEPKNEKDIDFMKLNLIISNPQLILKPRYHMKEYFLIDLGTVNLSCFYQKVFGKIRNKPDEYRWNTTYQFDMKNITIVTEDGFNVLSPTNAIVNMHINQYTEKDKMLNEFEYDFSYQFDLFFEDMNMNLRQSDFMNLMRCSDLNILYTDEKEKKFDYTSTVTTNPNINNVNIENKEKLMKTYLSLITYVMFSKLSLTLYLSENNDTEYKVKPFMELVLKETQLLFTKDLSFHKHTKVIIADMEIYDISSTTNIKENILSDFKKNLMEFISNELDLSTEANNINNIHKNINFYQFKRENNRRRSSKGILLKIEPKISSLDFITKTHHYIKQCNIIHYETILLKGSKIQSEISITVDAQREKVYNVLLNGFKLLIKPDTFRLFQYFFLEGFPYYAKTNIDLPNLYDPNEENNPGMQLQVQIKQGLICFPTDDLSNKTQELICIASEVKVGMESKKISLVKSELYQRYLKTKSTDDKNSNRDVTWLLELSLKDVSPFMCNFNDLAITSGNEDLFIGKRKIMDKFDFTYEHFTQMQYMHQSNDYLIKSIENIKLSKLTIKASYRDMVLYVKMGEYFKYLLNENYYNSLDSLCYYTKQKEIYEQQQKSKANIEDKDCNSTNVTQIQSETSSQSHSQSTQGNVVDKGLKNQNVKLDGFQLILIDDHANTFYPFLSLIISACDYNAESLSYTESTAKSEICFKTLCYNYIAGMWEPLIENTKFTFESQTNSTNHLNIITKTNITFPEMYINISDLSIVFLGGILSKWTDKYKLVKDNYQNEIAHIQEAKNMTITNHTVFNYTGRTLTLSRKVNTTSLLSSVIKQSTKENMNIQEITIAEIEPNDSYEIEYFDESPIQHNQSIIYPASSSSPFSFNISDKNIISFKLNECRVSNRDIQIDNNMQTKIHQVDYISFANAHGYKELIKKYSYIVSTIEYHNLKKHIYFYPPLSFKNKTNFTFNILLHNKQKDQNITLYPKQTIGIPFEFLNGHIRITVVNGTKSFSYPLQYFLVNKDCTEEMQIDGENYINLYHPTIYGENTFFSYKIINILTSYSIRNCLPFDIQIIVNHFERFININQNETVSLPFISVKDNLYVQLFFYSFRTKDKALIFNRKEQKAIVPIVVHDERDNPLELYASIISVDNGTEIILHANTLIINHTGLNIYFTCGYEENKVNTPIANQKNHNNFFLMNDEQFLVLSYNGFKSNAIPINALSTNTIIEMVNKSTKKKIELIMETTLSLVAIDLDIYTNTITFLPRYILYNQLGNYRIDVLLDNGNVVDKLDKLYPNEKKQLYYTTYHSRKNTNSHYSEDVLRFLLIDVSDPSDKGRNIAQWERSTPYVINSGTLTTLFVKHKTRPNEKMYFNIEKQVDNLSTYLTIKPTTLTTSQIKIENYSSSVSIKTYQETFQTNAFYINCKCQSIFAWTDITKNSILYFEFYIGDFNTNPICFGKSSRKYEILDNKIIVHEQSNETEITKYPYETVIKLNKTPYSGVCVKLTIQYNGTMIVIAVNDIIEDIKSISNTVQIDNIYEFNINKLGISLIGDNQYIKDKDDIYERHEICFITLDNIILYLDNNVKDKVSQSKYAIIVNDVEIDNQMDYITNLPIIFLAQESPRKKESASTSSNSNNNVTSFGKNPFFNCAFYITSQPNEQVTRINLFNYLIQAFDLNIESSVLVGLLNFFKNVTVGMQTSVTQINPLFVSAKEKEKLNIKISDWKYSPLWLEKQELATKQNTLLINELTCSSLEISLTFISQTKDKVFQQLLQTNKMLSSLLNAVSDIEKAQLSLNGSTIFNFQGNWSDLITNLLTLYKQGFLNEIHKMFGSIDLIGSPLNLFQSLSKGVNDFFQKPKEGVIHGPLQGVLGLVDGSVSFVKHTVDGTFGSASKLTGGVSKSMLLLTQDYEFINEREIKKKTEKPANVVEGLGFGLSSMASGIFSGITGIFTKPIEGAKEGDIKGFGKGLLQGLSGAIVKPISGVFDLVSKTTEGIKNSVQDELNIKCVRLPRAFYGQYKVIKNYNKTDARVIKNIKEQMDIKKDFYSCTLYRNAKGDSQSMVFFTDGFQIIDVMRKEKKVFIAYSDIKNVTKENACKVKIHFTRELYKRTHTSITLSEHNSKTNAEELVEHIKDALNANCEERNI